MNEATILTNAKSFVSGDGFVVRKPIPLAALNLGTNVAIAADETNAIVAKVTLANDVVFNQDIAIPYDYDEAQDHLKVRVLVSMLTLSTDDDVEVDAEAYKKRAGVALGSDVAPVKVGTVLTVAEQWIETDVSGNTLIADDILIFKLITNGGNDTSGEEVLLHAVQIEYKTDIVAFDNTDRD